MPTNTMRVGTAINVINCQNGNVAVVTQCLLHCKGSIISSNGEPGRNRTCDPRIKSALLYQLSYGPTFF